MITIQELLNNCEEISKDILHNYEEIDLLFKSFLESKKSIIIKDLNNENRMFIHMYARRYITDTNLIATFSINKVLKWSSPIAPHHIHYVKKEGQRYVKSADIIISNVYILNDKKHIVNLNGKIGKETFTKNLELPQKRMFPN